MVYNNIDKQHMVYNNTDITVGLRTISTQYKIIF